MNMRGVVDWLLDHFKLVLILIWLPIVVFICFGVFFLFSSSEYPVKTLLELNIAPSTATVKVDGKEYRNGSFEIEPGKYTITISAKGFDSKTSDITVEKNTTNKLTAYLTNSSNGLKYYERSEKDLPVLRSLAKEDELVSDFLAAYDKKVSIKKKLPLRITYDDAGPLESLVVELYANPKCSEAVCLKIKLPTLHREYAKARAKKLIEDSGFTFEDYEVYYE